MSEQTPEIALDAFATEWQRGIRVIDVRSPEEYASGHVPGAVNVPLADVLAAPQRFADDQLRVLCQTGGGRSVRAAEAMNAAGARALSVSGGTSAWIEAGHQIDQEENQ